MSKETYPIARKRLLDRFASEGFETKPDLKVPQVKIPDHPDDSVLYFHAQAVYLNAHSLHIDIRGLSFEALCEDIQKTIAIRRKTG